MIFKKMRDFCKSFICRTVRKLVYKMRKIELEELKIIQLDILNVFRDICRQNGLRYFLAAGTALGAIRHQGFIPWDDDIDVLMTREDYEKLLNLKDLRCAAHYKLLHSRNVEHFGLPIALLVDARTYVEEKQLLPELVNRRHGVHIEIFPIDGLPNNRLLRCWHWARCNFTRKLMYLCLFDKFVPSHKHGTAVNFIGRILTIAGKRFLGYQYLLRELDKIGKKYKVDGAEFVSGLVWQGYTVDLPRKHIDGTEEVIFEGFKHTSFVYCRDYLQATYGDYMKLPPEEKRIGHGMHAWWRE